MMEMAFNESDPIPAYFPCDKIQELAVNYLINYSIKIYKNVNPTNL